MFLNIGHRNTEVLEIEVMQTNRIRFGRKNINTNNPKQVHKGREDTDKYIWDMSVWGKVH